MPAPDESQSCPMETDTAQLKGRYCIDYDRLLNPSQLSAVIHDKGPLLVIAGAGSGKTRTLTYRVARLIEDGIPPSSILLLSFTRKASREMLHRAAGLLDERCRKVAGGTFHSFSNSVLRRYAGLIGFTNGFSIIDRSDSEDLIGMIRKDFSLSRETNYLPRKSTLATIFSKAVNKSLPLEEIIYEEYPHFAHQQEIIYNIWDLYREGKQSHNFLDYDDLLVLLRRLLNEHPAVRDRLAFQYRYIMVDEYQDTNIIQADIVSLLSGVEKNVMVVGDDAQSIYAFRGANFKNIIAFPERFSGARIIKLEQNYRSLQPILDLSNSLIEPAAEKYAKCLFTKRSGGNRPILVAAAGENAQSRYVTQEIIKLAKDNVPLDQVAVLFRAGFHSFDLELELNRAAIPHIKVGGFKFVESAHIKDVLAHIKIHHCPQDPLSWYRVLLLLPKIGAQTAQRIYDAVINEGGGATGLLTAPIKRVKTATLEPLKALISAMDAAPGSVMQWGEMVLHYYKPLLEKKYDDFPRRTRDIEQLITIMARYDKIDDFLTDMALEPPNTASDNGLSVEDQKSHHLTLSTIHSAKGLEWHTVFIIWALDGRFPSYHAMDDPDALEEERRLMYVAATRAEQQLHIIYPMQIYDRTTQSMLYEPSRFLTHISQDILQVRYCD
ncbi:MAG: ATP-dependent helicase [Desulfatitalea sp.]|nr:ATP-dependent helicase [Desulfatitalea sp.]